MRLLAVERAISVLCSAADADADAAAARAAALSCICTVHGPTEWGTVQQHYFRPAFILPVAMRVPTDATEVVLTGVSLIHIHLV